MNDAILDDPIRLRAALLFACLVLAEGDPEFATELYEVLYDSAAEKMDGDIEAELLEFVAEYFDDQDQGGELN